MGPPLARRKRGLAEDLAASRWRPRRRSSACQSPPAAVDSHDIVVPFGPAECSADALVGVWLDDCAEVSGASCLSERMKPATSSSPTCRRFSSSTCTSAQLQRCTKSGRSAKSSLARGHAGAGPDQPLAVMPAVGGRSSSSTMFDQPLAVIASRLRQEFTCVSRLR